MTEGKRCDLVGVQLREWRWKWNERERIEREREREREREERERWQGVLQEVKGRST